jgi:hypothetical protein
MTRNEKSAMTANLKWMIMKYKLEEMNDNTDLKYQMMLIHIIEVAKKMVKSVLQYSMDRDEIDDYFANVDQQAYEIACDEYKKGQKDEG